MFETETMAELCVQQGLLGEATEIYRRLVANAPDEITGARRRQRLGELERQRESVAKPKTDKVTGKVPGKGPEKAPGAGTSPAAAAATFPPDTAAQPENAPASSAAQSALKSAMQSIAPRPAAPAPATPEVLPLPGVHATWDRRHAVVVWRLPPETEAPALELLLVLRTAAGILTERRTLRLDRAEGRMALPVPDLYSVRAAAGRMDGERFVPLVRVDSDPRR